MRIITTIDGAERFDRADAESVEVKTIGVHLTETSVVFYDPETADTWLAIRRSDFNRLHEISQIKGLESGRIHPDLD